MAAGRINVIAGFEVLVEPTSTLEEYGLFPHIVDLNPDRILELNDLAILIEYWRTDELLCDIAPPDGDGTANVLDLEIFMG